MAALSCGMKVIKYLLFGFNVVFFIMGFSMLVSGIVVMSVLGGHPIAQFFDGKLNYAGALVIVVGVFVMVLAFFGCCGAFNENKCMVNTYAILMIILVLIQIIVVIIGGALSGQIGSLVEEYVDKTMEEYDPNISYTSDTNAVTNAWDTMQQELKCCGLNSAEEWLDNLVYKNTTNVPDSCCITHQTGCGKGALRTNKIFKQPCKDALLAWIQSNIAVGIGMGTVVFLLQIVGIIFACCLSRQIGNYKEV